MPTSLKAEPVASIAYFEPTSRGAEPRSLTSFSLASDTVQRRQYNPLRAARLYAAVSVAEAEAVANSPAASAGQGTVAVQAGALVLSWMLPQEAASTWVVRAGAAQAAGTARADAEQDIAKRSAGAVIERTLQDRADARRRPLPKPPPQPGIWIRTPPLLAEQPPDPQAPQWLPWCPGSERLQAPEPPAYGSTVWKQDMAEVQQLRTRLTPAQKLAAERWHLDAGSVTPPGVWNLVVRDYLDRHPLPPARHYRVLALLNMAMHDALVASWRVKLTYWTERPLTAIRREIDPDFEPLLVTPPFPGYVSGHATVSGAAAGVLSRLLPQARAQWQALAREAADSRMWGGIHPRFDNDEGLRLGEEVARVCVERFEPPPAEGSAERLPIPLVALPQQPPSYWQAMPSLARPAP